MYTIKQIKKIIENHADCHCAGIDPEGKLIVSSLCITRDGQTATVIEHIAADFEAVLDWLGY